MRESMTALPSHEHYKGYIYIYTHTYTYTYTSYTYTSYTASYIYITQVKDGKTDPELDFMNSLKTLTPDSNMHVSTSSRPNGGWMIP